MQWKWLADLFAETGSVIEIMDIGAMVEGIERYAPLVEMGLARVVGFEPNPEQIAELERQRPNNRYLPYFLGDGSLATFHQTNYPGCCSLLEPDPAVINLFSGMDAGPNSTFGVAAIHEVETARLDDVAEAGFPDFVKLDTQGSELAILRHGMNRLRDAVMIECEAEFIPLYKGQPLFADIAAFLTGHGFVLHTLVDVAGRGFRPFTGSQGLTSPVSQLMWADAVFVRDFTRLDRLSTPQLLKTVLLSTVLYQSVDLAALLLKEVDRRNGSALREAYIEQAMTHCPRPSFLSIRTE